MLRPVPRLGPGIAYCALLLALTSLIWPGQVPLAQAMGLPAESSPGAVALSTSPDSPLSPSPVPRPASRYALDAEVMGNVMEDVGAFTSTSVNASADDAVYRCRFEASSPHVGTTNVDSIISILNTAGQADEKYTDTQKLKKGEHNVQFEGVPGWNANRVSAFQTPNASGERVTGTLLRFRNVVALVEIRGSAQRVSVEDSKALMKKILHSLRKAAETPH